MPIIFLAVLIFLIVMIVKYTQAALIIGASLIALGVAVKLVRRMLSPPESRSAGNISGRRAPKDEDLEWWKSNQTGPS
jgi:hypothetical protein